MVLFKIKLILFHASLCIDHSHQKYANRSPVLKLIEQLIFKQFGFCKAAVSLMNTCL